jgi:hypothetical protein
VNAIAAARRKGLADFSASLLISPYAIAGCSFGAVLLLAATQIRSPIVWVSLVAFFAGWSAAWSP